MICLLVPTGITGGDYKFYIRQSVCPFTMFFGVFSQNAHLLHRNFVHGFLFIISRLSSKMVGIDQFLEELRPLNLAI
jgi:hypothetical protein